MSFAKKALDIFEKSIQNYHINNQLDEKIKNPFDKDSLESTLYQKNWIDTVQWHLEDEIRVPSISAEKGMDFKRKIDRSNQDRTDLVEQIDDYFLEKYNSVQVKENARLNTESPAWALDRLSILSLKIYHMAEECNDENSSNEHKARCTAKLAVLQEQAADLTQSIDDLLQEIESGKVVMKVYRQMKMYNDPSLNPKLKAE